jgi:hypothetical protein
MNATAIPAPTLTLRIVTDARDAVRDALDDSDAVAELGLSFDDVDTLADAVGRAVRAELARVAG